MVQVDNHLTKTQKRMLDVLSDGELHLREELQACIGDELSNLKNVPPHICLLRKKLPAGYLIVHQQRYPDRKYCYRLVRRIESPYTGRT